MTREYIAVSYREDGDSDYIAYYYYYKYGKRNVGYTDDLRSFWVSFNHQSQFCGDRLRGYKVTRSKKKINKFLMIMELLK